MKVTLIKESGKAMPYALTLMVVDMRESSKLNSKKVQVSSITQMEALILVTGKMTTEMVKVFTRGQTKANSQETGLEVP